jgi:Ca2+-binding RTX toxin-like protein
MSNTASLNIANIQVYAEAQAAIDRSNGTFSSNVSNNSRYYLWQSEFQTIPMGMNGNPEQFVQKLVAAIPGVNSIRIPFNIHSFDANGRLDPLFERFLISAAATGLQLIPVLADGGAQRFDGTAQQIESALRGEIFHDLVGGWRKMLTWMDNHHSVRDMVYGWELVNEPATYQRAVTSAPHATREDVQQKIVGLYVEHMSELAEMIAGHSDARLLVSAWGYGGDTATLAQSRPGGPSAIDLLRSSLGDALIWSVHFYPGWMGTEEKSSLNELIEIWTSFLDPLGLDDIIMTEINTPGFATYNPFHPFEISTTTALAMEWLKSEGIGVGWFPALQTGSSGLALIEESGSIRYLNQPSLAAALNAFSFGADPVDARGSDFVLPVLVAAKLRNQQGDPDYAQRSIDLVRFAGLGFGHGGSDTLLGSELANNFLYGGTGADVVVGSSNDDFLFGQDGPDLIISGRGINHLFGGQGADTLVGQSGHTVAWGGAGADVFTLQSGSRMIVADFSALETDSWAAPTAARLIAYEYVASSIDGRRDLLFLFSDSSEILFTGKGDFQNMVGVLGQMQPSTSLTESVALALRSVRLVNETDLLPNNLPSSDWIPAADYIPMNSSADSISGGAGADFFETGQGRDTVHGLHGDDSIYGGSGHDLLFGGSGSDQIWGGTGDDTLFGGIGSDLLMGGAGNDILSGGDGDDQLWGGHGHDVLFGGDGNDSFTLIGSTRHSMNYVAFNASSATQIGTGQRVDLNGKVRIETVIDGGAGVNAIYLGDDGTALFLHDAYSGFHPSLSLTPDYIGANSIQRFMNIQRIFGMNGNDIIDLTSPDYSLAGESITIDGGGGDDVIWGSDADEVIYGGTGDDTIFSGIGRDVLYGGPGSDVFEFTMTSTNTVVADFDPAEGDLLRFYNTGEAQFDPRSIKLTNEGIKIMFWIFGTSEELSVSLALSPSQFDLNLQQIVSAVEIF